MADSDSYLYDDLPAAGQKLARIPRTGRLIGRMRTEQLKRLDSNAAVYHEVLHYVADNEVEATGLIDGGLRTSSGSMLGWRKPGTANRKNPLVRQWQMKLASDMLSAVAFEMFLGKKGDGKSPPLYVYEGNVPRFLVERVYPRILESNCYVDDIGRKLDESKLADDWFYLSQMNAQGLEYLILGDMGKQSIFFSDRTMQTFFAARWACTRLVPKDLEKIKNWYPVDNDRKEDYKEFWSYVLELESYRSKYFATLEPEDQPIDRGCWEALFSPLFDGSFRDSECKVIRSTELIYRSWVGMKGSEAREKYEGEFGKLLDDRNAVAMGLLWETENESQFLSLCEGERSVGDPESLEDDGKLGEQELEHYRLHRYCVTNSEYELFDTRHVSLREFEEGGRKVSCHPVVNVSWYDAWCFARWLGKQTIGGREYRIVLPKEEEWEYACRCKETKDFTWHDRQNGDRIESGYCNFNGNNPWPNGVAQKSAKPIWLRRTIPVDGLDSELEVKPNPWGFHQMHGNVFEWCWDWYEEGVDRVPCGGSWFNFGESCRSGRRFGFFAPSLRFRYRGFRLAAVPMSQAGDDERE